jgi:hypothetical protein
VQNLDNVTEIRWVQLRPHSGPEHLLFTDWGEDCQRCNTHPELASTGRLCTCVIRGRMDKWLSNGWSDWWKDIRTDGLVGGRMDRQNERTPESQTVGLINGWKETRIIEFSKMSHLMGIGG